MIIKYCVFLKYFGVRGYYEENSGEMKTKISRKVFSINGDEFLYTPLEKSQSSIRLCFKLGSQGRQTLRSVNVVLSEPLV